MKNLAEQMNRDSLGWLKRSLMVIDSLIKLHFHFDPEFKVKELNLTTLAYLRFYYIRQNTEDNKQG